MLSKMSLRYFNGQLYQDIQETQETPEFSREIREIRETREIPQVYKPKTKEEYIQLVRYQILLRRKMQQEQKEKRKLLISATNGSIVKVNTANSLFRLK